MGTDYPSKANRIDALLVVWHEALAASGRELSAAELCRDCPELVAEVEQRLRGVRRSEGSLGTPDGDPAQTANWGPPPDRADPDPRGDPRPDRVGRSPPGARRQADHRPPGDRREGRAARPGRQAGGRSHAR